MGGESQNIGTIMLFYIQLFRMNNDDRNECLRQLSAKLSQQIARSVIFMALAFYLIYLLIQNAYAFYQFEALQISEFSFLKSIGNNLARVRKNEETSILNFLDSSNQILKYVNVGNYSNLVCNSNFYLCNDSNAKDYGIFDKSIVYLKANAQALKRTSVNGLFLKGSNTTVVVNVSNFGLFQGENMSFISSNLNLTTSSDEYQYRQLQIDSTGLLIVICSKITLSQTLSLCLTYSDQKVGNIGSNYYLIKNDKDLYNEVDPSKRIFLSNILGYIKKQPYDPVTDISNCLAQYPTNYGKYIHISEGLQIICKHNIGYFLNFFGTSYLFRVYRQQIDRRNAIAKPQSIYEIPKFIKYIFISSNSSFYQRIYNARLMILTDIRQTGYLVLFTISCSILLICISNYIIDQIFLYSIDIITTVCQFIKNREEKQFNNQLSKGKPIILNFIVDFLKKFMWIFKLRKFKGKFMYKKLLLEGLQIFDQINYIPVLKFIYRQLITLESTFAEKLFKIKELPHKKKQVGSKYEEQEKIIVQPVVAHEQRVNRRRNANFNLLNPDDDQLMKNISISFRGNRGVRFSNDIQTIQIDQGPILRKAKCSQIQMVSCQTIKNDLSEIDNDSLKRSDFNKDSLKSLKSQQQSFTSLIDVSRGKKKDSTKTRSLQSIHIDLDNLKLDQEMEDDELLLDQQSEQDQVYSKTREEITLMIAQNYRKIIKYYEKLYNILNKEIQSKTQDQQKVLANQLYVLTIGKYEKYYQLLLFQASNQLGRQIEPIQEFQDFIKLQRSYNHYFSNQLIQQAQVLKQGIFQAQHSPISLQNLQEIYCKSNNKKIRIAARTLLALVAEQHQPHLDLVLAKNIYANLKEQKTTSAVKQQNLAIFMRNLQRYTNFWEELEQLKMAAQFYNTKNKKFYFLASIASIKLFTPVLSKFYQLLDNFDIFNIYNLEEEILESTENQLGETVRKRKLTSDKIKYLMDVPQFIELFNFTNDKQKENQANSVKTISRKRLYEKEFHQILMMIEQDEVEYSKYIVIFLGDDHSLSSSQTEQSSSSANHRPFQQKIHLQITKVIQKGYMHFILVGYHLESYPSKYGRLKKYVKLSPQLFQVQLSNKDQQEHMRRLQKYLR